MRGVVYYYRQLIGEQLVFALEHKVPHLGAKVLLAWPKNAVAEFNGFVVYLQPNGIFSVRLVAAGAAVAGINTSAAN